MASTPAQSPPLPAPERRTNSVSTKQAAYIGLVGVLLSAILSIVAGLISAKLAGDAAANTVAQQQSGESERSRAEFLRGQQQVLYASLVNAHESAQAREGAWGRAVLARKANAKGLERSARSVAAQFDERDGEVEVIASMAVVNAFDDLNKVHRERINVTRAHADLVSRNAPQAERDESVKKLRGVISEQGASEDKLFGLMRKDLGNR
jgi:hypothetical protein